MKDATRMRAAVLTLLILIYVTAYLSHGRGRSGPVKCSGRKTCRSPFAALTAADRVPLDITVHMYIISGITVPQAQPAAPAARSLTSRPDQANEQSAKRFVSLPNFPKGSTSGSPARNAQASRRPQLAAVRDAALPVSKNLKREVGWLPIGEFAARSARVSRPRGNRRPQISCLTGGHYWTVRFTPPPRTSHTLPTER